ncbi:cell division ATP-binding protein FtsE [Candidatus Uhrbacteria bacterium]|nr:cell division ATP-binding protein FtsE [Candidatus Uhrbacteria bacterium]
MITFNSITKVYPPDVRALDRVSFHIEPGEFVSIVGQSGTGKTTLVRLLIAEERPSDGNIVIGGWDISRIRGAEIPTLRRQIGIVFQDFKLLHRKTIGENVAFALEVCGAPTKRIREVVPSVLRIVGLHEKVDRFPWQLSGGEQQRVAIARALVHGPKILVADEPTGNLDSIHTREIADLLEKINRFGTTVLLVTHNRDIVNMLRRRVITLDAGRIVSDQVKGKYRL